MPVPAIIFLLAVFGLSLGYTRGVFKHAQANGRAVPSRGDWKPRLPAILTSRQPAAATTAGATRAKGAGKAKGAKGRPLSVPAILAAGVIENWVAHRAHVRANPKQSLRHRAFARLVLPGRRAAPASPPPPPSGGTTMTTAAVDGSGWGGGPESTRAPSSGSPSIPGGHSGGGGGYGGGGAGDLGSALTRVITEGEAGGLKSKTRTALVLGEGHKMSGAYLEQYARHLQERGEYPAFAWEPVRAAAAMITAAATKLTEHATAMQTIANTPMGEAAGKAPAKPELDKE